VNRLDDELAMVAVVRGLREALAAVGPQLSAAGRLPSLERF
jgi:hypothetical protein